VVNDLYHRFVNPQASENQQVWAGRVATIVLMIVACTLALFLENALQVFNIVLQIGAGTGLIFILRWFWWRVNAEAELTAMIVSFVVAMVFAMTGGMGLPGWAQLLVGVLVTTACWVAAAYLFPSTDEATLKAFYQKIRPGGRGWTRVASSVGADAREDGSDFPQAVLGMVFGAGMIYGILFTTGYVLYGQTLPALITGVLALGCAVGLRRVWPTIRFA
jgi:SSS family solute:Na+ symporter